MISLDVRAGNIYSKVYIRMLSICLQSSICGDIEHLYNTLFLYMRKDRQSGCSDEFIELPDF